MAKRIKAYIAYIDRLLENNDTSLSYEEILTEHEKMISFFQHERLVHELVMLCFALLTILIFILNYVGIFFFGDFSVGLFILLVLFLALLIPYIKHYFLLENSCQYMYQQYDALKQHISKDYFIES